MGWQLYSVRPFCLRASVRFDRKERIMQDCYIYTNGQRVPVSKEVYREYMRPVWAEQKRQERAKRCRIGGVRCTGDCSQCTHMRTGTAVSLERLDEVNHTPEDLSADVQEIVEGRLLLEALFRQLEELNPDGQLLCRLLLDGESERQIAGRLGISQVAVNKRKQRVFSILREALSDWK